MGQDSWKDRLRRGEGEKLNKSNNQYENGSSIIQTTYGSALSGSLEDLTKSTTGSLGDLESIEFLNLKKENKHKFVPFANFEDPSTFVKFGSAERYYLDSISRIYNQYPYDGSLTEKEEWHVSSSFLDTYIFNNKYPKTTGYVLFSPSGWGDASESTSLYATPVNSEYIYFEGGPHPDPKGDFKSIDSLANVYDPEENRESNLKINPALGNTIEFWLNKQELVNSSKTSREVVFDLWTSDHLVGNSSNARVRIELDCTAAADHWIITYLSGSTPVGFDRQSIGSSAQITGSNWNHHAFTFRNDASGKLFAEYYNNGQLNDTKNTTGFTSDIKTNLVATIGALGSKVTTTGPEKIGSAKLSGSIDEFRFWKSKRTPKDIGSNYFTHVHGGTNKRVYNTDLGVYYKFNEGISGDGLTDEIILDYSGRITNGKFYGYNQYSRSTGSAIDESVVESIEDKDPIIHTNNPLLSSFIESKKQQGRYYDYSNNSSIVNSLPSWILNEEYDNSNRRSLLVELTQIISSYFDSLFLNIQELSKLNNLEYRDYDSKLHPSGSKPYPFNDRILSSYGFKTYELFSNLSVIERFLQKNDRNELEEDVSNVKNFIYRNIANNLSYIYKSKGTESSFRNLIRCLGIGEETLKLNAYADNYTYEFKDNYKQLSTKNNAISFYAKDSGGATIYQNYEDSSTRSYIPGISHEGITNTFEINLITPMIDNAILDDEFKQRSLFSSVFGVRRPKVVDPENDYTVHPSDSANLTLKIEKYDHSSNYGRFVLESTVPGIDTIRTDYIPELFTDRSWNVIVSLEPQGGKFSSLVSGSSSSYNLTLRGSNYISDTVQDTFSLSSVVSKSVAEGFVSSNKRVFIGAERQNFTGSLVNHSEIKVDSFRHYLSGLSDKEHKLHSIDNENFGRDQDTAVNLFSKEEETIELSKNRSMLLHWDFDLVRGSDSSGQFSVVDLTKSEPQLGTSYNSAFARIYPGKGDKFPASNTKFVVGAYRTAGKRSLPEYVYSHDQVILTQPGDFTERPKKDARPIKNIYAFEKSMYQSVSEEMLKFVSSVEEFNNLIGEPVNKYREDYKKLNKLRELFFTFVDSGPDVERYVNYYRWLDNSVSLMLEQLMPATVKFRKKLNNMVESHIFERNKYKHNYPTIDRKQRIPEGKIYGLSELLYDWEFGHAPLAESHNITGNCLWWSERAERNETSSSSVANLISTGNAAVDNQREKIKNFAISHTSGSSYADRKFTKVYNLTTDIITVIHSGFNFKSFKFPNILQNDLGLGSEKEIVLPAANIVSTDRCVDLDDPSDYKESVGGTLSTNYEDDYSNGDSDMLLPFSLHSGSYEDYSSSTPRGYLDSSGLHSLKPGIDITNLHSDSYHSDFSVPLQTSLHEKFQQGGYPHRHFFAKGIRGIAAQASLTIGQQNWSASDKTPYKNILGTDDIVVSRRIRGRNSGEENHNEIVKIKHTKVIAQNKNQIVSSNGSTTSVSNSTDPGNITFSKSIDLSPIVVDSKISIGTITATVTGINKQTGVVSYKDVFGTTQAINGSGSLQVKINSEIDFLFTRGDARATGVLSRDGRSVIMRISRSTRPPFLLANIGSTANHRIYRDRMISRSLADPDQLFLPEPFAFGLIDANLNKVFFVLDPSKTYTETNNLFYDVDYGSGVFIDYTKTYDTDYKVRICRIPCGGINSLNFDRFDRPTRSQGLLLSIFNSIKFAYDQGVLNIKPGDFSGYKDGVGTFPTAFGVPLMLTSVPKKYMSTPKIVFNDWGFGFEEDPRDGVRLPTGDCEHSFYDSGFRFYQSGDVPGLNSALWGGDCQPIKVKSLIVPGDMLNADDLDYSRTLASRFSEVINLVSDRALNGQYDTANDFRNNQVEILKKLRAKVSEYDENKVIISLTKPNPVEFEELGKPLPIGGDEEWDIEFSSRVYKPQTQVRQKIASANGSTDTLDGDSNRTGSLIINYESLTALSNRINGQYGGRISDVQVGDQIIIGGFTGVVSSAPTASRSSTGRPTVTIQYTDGRGTQEIGPPNRGHLFIDFRRISNSSLKDVSLTEFTNYERVVSGGDRPEKIDIKFESSSIKVKPVSAGSQRSIFTRDGMLKRVVNIRNIQSESPGNYNHSVEVNRYSNETSQRRRVYKEPSIYNKEYTESATVENSQGFVDFENHREKTNENIRGKGVISMFYRPGGPGSRSYYLTDYLFGEYSPYNSIAYANNIVRDAYTHVLSQHATRFGFRSGTMPDDSTVEYGFKSSLPDSTPAHLRPSIGPSIHKTQRNTFHDAGTNKPKYDNFFVQYQIPRSDLQYKWIRDKTTNTVSRYNLQGVIQSTPTFGYEDEVNTLSFLTASEFGIAMQGDVSSDKINFDITTSEYSDQIGYVNGYWLGARKDSVLNKRFYYSPVDSGGSTKSNASDINAAYSGLLATGFQNNWKFIPLSTVGLNHMMVSSFDTGSNMITTRWNPLDHHKKSIRSVDIKQVSSGQFTTSSIIFYESPDFSFVESNLHSELEGKPPAFGQKLYQEDFNSATHNALPAGWTANTTTLGDSLTLGARVLQKVYPSTDSNDKVLSLKGGKIRSNELTDSPIDEIYGLRYYNTVQLNTGFTESKIRISFKLKAGYRTPPYGSIVCPYGMEPPDVNGSEDLFLQYKVGATGTWLNGDSEAGNHNNLTSTRFLDRYGITKYGENKFYTVAYIIEAGQNEQNPIYFRWVARSFQSSSTYDHWAIDDIRVDSLVETDDESVYPFNESYYDNIGIHLNSYIMNKVAPYGWNSWSSLRSGEKSIVRHYNSQNINSFSVLSRANSNSEVANYKDPISFYSRDFIHLPETLRESAKNIDRFNVERLSRSRRPFEENFSWSNKISGKTFSEKCWLSSYRKIFARPENPGDAAIQIRDKKENFLSRELMFANNNIITAARRRLIALESDHASMQSRNRDIVNLFYQGNEIPNYSFVKSTIFPERVNQGTHQIRSRTNFDCSFWKDEISERVSQEDKVTYLRLSSSVDTYGEMGNFGVFRKTINKISNINSMGIDSVDVNYAATSSIARPLVEAHSGSNSFINDGYLVPEMLKINQSIWPLDGRRNYMTSPTDDLKDMAPFPVNPHNADHFVWSMKKVENPLLTSYITASSELSTKVAGSKGLEYSFVPTDPNGSPLKNSKYLSNFLGLPMVSYTSLFPVPFLKNNANKEKMYGFSMIDVFNSGEKGSDSILAGTSARFKFDDPKSALRFALLTGSSFSPSSLNSYLVQSASLDTRSQRGEGELQNDYSIYHMGSSKLHITPPPAMLYSRRVPQSIYNYGLTFSNIHVVAATAPAKHTSLITSANGSTASINGTTHPVGVIIFDNSVSEFTNAQIGDKVTVGSFTATVRLQPSSLPAYARKRIYYENGSGIQSINPDSNVTISVSRGQQDISSTPDIAGTRGFQVLSGDAKWEAGDQYGSNPFYKSYDEFREDYRGLDQEYSLVPEFRISDYMDNIVNGTYGEDMSLFPDAVANSENSGLVLSGSSNTENFDTTYSTAELTAAFGIAIEPLSLNGNFPQRINMKARAIAKLLPYDGFYPVLRTMHLGNIFSRDYVDPGFSSDQNLTAEQQEAIKRKISSSLNPAIKPLFSPGILYNSIKSGLAVDYPIFTNTGTGSMENEVLFELTASRNSSTASYANGLGLSIVDSHSKLKLIGTSGSSDHNGHPDFDSMFDDGSKYGSSVTGAFFNGTQDSSIPRLKGAVTRRVSFESLYNPESLNDTLLYDNEPHPSASFCLSGYDSWKIMDFPYKFNSVQTEQFREKWGVPVRKNRSEFLSYKLAMNNFLAESVDTFLSRGKLSVARSAPSETWSATLERGKRYGMRVFLDNTRSNMYDRFSSFGPPVDSTENFGENQVRRVSVPASSDSIILTGSSNSVVSTIDAEYGNIGDFIHKILVKDIAHIHDFVWKLKLGTATYSYTVTNDANTSHYDTSGFATLSEVVRTYSTSQFSSTTNALTSGTGSSATSITQNTSQITSANGSTATMSATTDPGNIVFAAGINLSAVTVGDTLVVGTVSGTVSSVNTATRTLTYTGTTGSDQSLSAGAITLKVNKTYKGVYKDLNSDLDEAGNNSAGTRGVANTVLARRIGWNDNTTIMDLIIDLEYKISQAIKDKKDQGWYVNSLRDSTDFVDFLTQDGLGRMVFSIPVPQDSHPFSSAELSTIFYAEPKPGSSISSLNTDFKKTVSTPVYHTSNAVGVNYIYVQNNSVSHKNQFTFDVDDRAVKNFTGFNSSGLIGPSIADSSFNGLSNTANTLPVPGNGANPPNPNISGPWTNASGANQWLTQTNTSGNGSGLQIYYYETVDGVPKFAAPWVLGATTEKEGDGLYEIGDEVIFTDPFATTGTLSQINGSSVGSSISSAPGDNAVFTFTSASGLGDLEAGDVVTLTDSGNDTISFTVASSTSSTITADGPTVLSDTFTVSGHSIAASSNNTVSLSISSFGTFDSSFNTCSLSFQLSNNSSYSNRELDGAGTHRSRIYIKPENVPSPTQPMEMSTKYFFDNVAMALNENKERFQVTASVVDSYRKFSTEAQQSSYSDYALFIKRIPTGPNASINTQFEFATPTSRNYLYSNLGPIDESLRSSTNLFITGGVNSSDENVLVNNQNKFSFDPYVPPFLNKSEDSPYIDYVLDLTGNDLDNIQDISSVQNVMSNLTITYGNRTTTRGTSLAGTAKDHAMNLSATFDTTTLPDVQDVENFRNDRRSDILFIYPKWETPVLDFEDSTQKVLELIKTQDGTNEVPIDTLSSFYKLREVEVSGPSPYNGTNPHKMYLTSSKGMWHQYGTYRGGYTLRITDHPSHENSLADALGFKSENEDSKRVRIGTPRGRRRRDRKVISEALVVVPFYEDSNKNLHTIPFFNNSEPMTGTDFITLMNESNTVDGARADFKLDPGIQAQVELMSDYILPPNYDFLRFPNLETKLMFIMPFSHSLTSQDAVNWWQNLPISISNESKFKESFATHSLFPSIPRARRNGEAYSISSLGFYAANSENILGDPNEDFRVPCDLSSSPPSFDINPILNRPNESSALEALLAITSRRIPNIDLGTLALTGESRVDDPDRASELARQLIEQSSRRAIRPIEPPTSGSDVDVILDILRQEALGRNRLRRANLTENAERCLRSLQKIRWKVFKIKKRAKTSYAEKIVSSLLPGNQQYQDSLVRELFDNPDRIQNLGNLPNVTDVENEIQELKNYSWNWPYDFFSLIELVRVDTKVDFEKEDSADWGKRMQYSLGSKFRKVIKESVQYVEDEVEEDDIP